MSFWNSWGGAAWGNPCLPFFSWSSLISALQQPWCNQGAEGVWNTAISHVPCFCGCWLACRKLLLATAPHPCVWWTVHLVAPSDPLPLVVKSFESGLALWPEAESTRCQFQASSLGRSGSFHFGTLREARARVRSLAALSPHWAVREPTLALWAGHVDENWGTQPTASCSVQPPALWAPELVSLREAKMSCLPEVHVGSK